MARKDRKRRRNGYVAFGNALLMIVVLAMVGGGAVLYWGWQQFSEPGPNAEARSFFVEENAGFNTTADRLREQGFISDSMMFKVIGGRLMGKTGDLKPGEFKVSANASMSDILKLLTETKPIDHFVMINPGDSSYVAAARLNDPDGASLLVGPPVEAPAEGTIKPVRYDYTPNATTRADLLKRMQDDMTAAVDKAWQSCRPDICGADALLKTKADLVTMASIVEKEAGNADELTTVASLYLNRLKKPMRLESDATILYGLYKGVPQSELEISDAEKSQKNAYNTYQIDGLPPTAIANPGEAALNAVANPADTDFIYMMAKVPYKTGEGHFFTSDFREHQNNVNKYYALKREIDAAAANEAAASSSSSEAAAQ